MVLNTVYIIYIYCKTAKCKTILTFFRFFVFSASYGGDCEDPYPSLSDFHDYEPNLEFDDSDLLQQKHPEHDDGNDLFRTKFEHKTLLVST
jgi:hypothetical protein